MTEKEAHKLLLTMTAEAYRIYHLIEDQQLADRQYQLALRLEKFLDVYDDRRASLMRMLSSPRE
jgi:hypothetical protein